MVVMIGLHLNGSTLEELQRLFSALGPAFEKNRADHGTPLSAAHVLPINRRSGVQDHSLFKTRDDFSCGCNVDQDRISGIDPSHRL
jgi:hypothetical protein